MSTENKPGLTPPNLFPECQTCPHFKRSSQPTEPNPALPSHILPVTYEDTQSTLTQNAYAKHVSLSRVPFAVSCQVERPNFMGIPIPFSEPNVKMTTSYRLNIVTGQLYEEPNKGKYLGAVEKVIPTGYTIPKEFRIEKNYDSEKCPGLAARKNKSKDNE